MFIENGTPKYPKAPEGRHVYRWRAHLATKAPEGRHVYRMRET